jgi:hypothetical protein
MTTICETIVRTALEKSGIKFIAHGEHSGRDADNRQKGLDFYLPDHDVHIEVKDFHSPRIADQMARTPNVIALQGRQACELFAALLTE